MTSEKIIEAFDDIARTIHARSSNPFMRLVPRRDPTATGHYARMSHLLWMAGAGVDLVREGRLEKACRWLGFLQGALWWAGIQSIENAKKHNMPAGAEFDANRR